jgi:hypothetical protein
MAFSAGYFPPAHIIDWATADRYLSAGRTERNRTSRKVGNNTYLMRDAYHDDDIQVILHYTPVVTYHRDGTTTLRTGGWWTRTTWSRVNAYSPVAVVSHRGHRWLMARGMLIQPFHDGITVDNNGRVVCT